MEAAVSRWLARGVALALVAAAVSSLTRLRPISPPKPAELVGKLRARVQAVDARLDGVLGVYVEDLSSGTVVELRADELVPDRVVDQAGGALRALPPGGRGPPRARRGHAPAAAARGRAAACSQDLGDRVSLTWRDLAVLMTCWSDNEATNLLIRRVGRDAVNRRLDALLAAARRACGAR